MSPNMAMTCPKSYTGDGAKQRKPVDCASATPREIMSNGEPTKDRPRRKTMSIEEDDPSRTPLADEEMKRAKKYLLEDDEKEKELDDEIQKAVGKSKKVIRDPEP
jgi:hypothetical protein